MSKTVSSLVLSDFEDASTGEKFAAGDKPPLSEGVFGNYKAAGLVREADPVKAEATAAPAAQAKPARSAKRPRSTK